MIETAARARRRSDNSEMAIHSVAETAPATFNADVIDASTHRPVLVIFSWLSSGRVAFQAYVRTCQRLALAASRDLKFVHMDVSAGPREAGFRPEVMERFGVYSVPTVLAYVGGVMVRSLQGGLPPIGRVRPQEISPLFRQPAERTSTRVTTAQDDRVE